MLAAPSLTPSDEGFCNLMRFLEERLAALITGNGPQYLAILNFTEDDLLKLESSGLRRELPGFRVLLDEENKTAIIKLMPGIPHEVAKVIFEEIFLGERATLGLPRNVFVPTGSGGLIDSLRHDARLWLQKTNGETKAILLIVLNIAAGTLTMEQWQHATSPLPRNTRSGSLLVPEKVQLSLAIPLILPIDLLLDVVPSQVPSSEISIGRQELLSYCIDVFDGLSTRIRELASQHP
ncbi:hypothetical protein V1506DRAFT_553508 [Lipomyces tetrasporus]